MVVIVPSDMVSSPSDRFAAGLRRPARGRTLPGASDGPSSMRRKRRELALAGTARTATDRVGRAPPSDHLAPPVGPPIKPQLARRAQPRASPGAELDAQPVNAR